MSITNDPGTHKLPELTYSYDALEPFIDARTMELHHSKHHQAYVDGLNGAEIALAEARISGDFSKIPALERAIAFHGSGHSNHTIFWNNLAPKGESPEQPGGHLLEHINAEFGSFDKFKDQFSAAAATVEGNGWGVLAFHPGFNKLYTLSVMNHQNLSVVGSVPLLLLDVWEHAYYLNYQNRRPEYIKNFWNIVNWKDVEARFDTYHSLVK